MHRSFRMVEVDGAGVNWLGANFWSRAGGPLMWRENYDPDLVRQELRVLRDHGLTMTRSFFYWPDFMPEPYEIAEDCVRRYADFLDAHVELGMRTIPTFLVGHMSGGNWDPPWRGGRDLYRDVWIVARQAWFIRSMTSRFAEHPAVTGWLVSNEMPIYGAPADRDTVSSWASLMVQAVRAGGGRQPVSVGDGAWGAEITGIDNGFSVRDLAALTDFLGPHVYRMEDDAIRRHYAAAFICELTTTLSAPVVLEEFGVTSDFACDADAAHYYRQVLHTTLLAGATGWIAWNNTDFDNLFSQDPYRHHAFELHFGLTTVDGTPKPQLVEMARFADSLRAIDIAGCQREPAQAALVVPEHLEGDLPSTRQEDNELPFAVLRQAYVSAKLADLPIGLTRERDGIAEDSELYLLPSTKQLAAPTWYALERLATNGAVVYVSYCPGTSGFQRGPWYAHLDRMFGVQHQLRYGLVDSIADDWIEFTFSIDFGGLTAGNSLSFRAGGNRDSRAYLPVRPTEAEVVATDQHGRPALLRRRAGDGWIVLCTYPLEHMAARTPAVNPDQASVLYNALAIFAGLHRAITVDDPNVAAETLAHADGRHFAFLTSQSDRSRTVTPATGQARLRDLTTGAAADTVELAPYDVRILLLAPDKAQ